MQHDISNESSPLILKKSLPTKKKHTRLKCDIKYKENKIAQNKAMCSIKKTYNFMYILCFAYINMLSYISNTRKILIDINFNYRTVNNFFNNYLDYCTNASHILFKYLNLIFNLKVRFYILKILYKYYFILKKALKIKFATKSRKRIFKSQYSMDDDPLKVSKDYLLTIRHRMSKVPKLKSINHTMNSSHFTSETPTKVRYMHNNSKMFQSYTKSILLALIIIWIFFLQESKHSRVFLAVYAVPVNLPVKPGKQFFKMDSDGIYSFAYDTGK